MISVVCCPIEEEGAYVIGPPEPPLQPPGPQGAVVAPVPLPLPVVSWGVPQLQQLRAAFGGSHVEHAVARVEHQA